MLSYQHAYHAANAADLHKHVALGVLLAPMAGRGALCVDAFAGRGLYDLDAAEAVKTGEAAAGLGRLVEAMPEGPPAGPFWRVLTRLRARDGSAAYPGSPAVAASLLDAGDRLILHERHPAEHAALMAARQRLDARGRGRDGPQVRVERTDGHEALRRIAPGKRPGLALVDPSYEVKDEYGWVAETVITARARWREGIVMAWYPLLPAGRHEAMAEAVVDTLGPVAIGGACLRHEVHLVDRPARGMVGSGLLIAGIGAAQVATLEAAWAACARVFHAPPA
ncbi:MAG: 23S rRNA (adenine(2030)-N(6))-methyltransferase RlmJ [Pseudomonadota bacterium]